MNNNYFLNEYGDVVGVPFDSFTKKASQGSHGVFSSVEELRLI